MTKSSYENVSDILFSLKFIVGFIILFMIINILYVLSTSFEKDIIVKEKYDRTVGKSTGYVIVGNDNTIYNLVNLWWKGDFYQSDNYAKMDVGKTYHVKGYGNRIPILGMYNNIYEINA